MCMWAIATARFVSELDEKQTDGGGSDGLLSADGEGDQEGGVSEGGEGRCRKGIQKSARWQILRVPLTRKLLDDLVKVDLALVPRQ